MSDAFRESNTIIFRDEVTFITGFGIVADQPFSIGSSSTNNSFLNTYNEIRPFGGISGYASSGYCESTFVHLIGDENISGEKTFQSSIIVGGNPIRNTTVKSSQINVFSGLLMKAGSQVACKTIDWINYGLITGNNASNVTVLNWGQKWMTGTWYVEELIINGQTVVPGGTTNIVGLISTGDADLRYVKTGDYLKPTQNYNLIINWNSGNIFHHVLTGNVVFIHTGYKDGQTIVVSTQNTGNTWYSGIFSGSNSLPVKWSYDIVPQISSGRRDIFTFINISTGLYGSVVQGFSAY